MSNSRRSGDRRCDATPRARRAAQPPMTPAGDPDRASGTNGIAVRQRRGASRGRATKGSRQATSGRSAHDGRRQRETTSAANRPLRRSSCSRRRGHRDARDRHRDRDRLQRERLGHHDGCRSVTAEPVPGRWERARRRANEPARRRREHRGTLTVAGRDRSAMPRGEVRRRLEQTPRRDIEPRARLGGQRRTNCRPSEKCEPRRARPPAGLATPGQPRQPTRPAAAAAGRRAPPGTVRISTAPVRSLSQGVSERITRSLSRALEQPACRGAARRAHPRENHHRRCRGRPRGVTTS